MFIWRLRTYQSQNQHKFKGFRYVHGDRQREPNHTTLFFFSKHILTFFRCQLQNTMCTEWIFNFYNRKIRTLNRSTAVTVIHNLQVLRLYIICLSWRAVAIEIFNFVCIYRIYRNIKEKLIVTTELESQWTNNRKT